MQDELLFDRLTNEQLLSMEPEKLMEVLSEKFRYKIPVTVESIEDMQTAGELLGRCSAEYSYLTNMALAAKLKKRKLKRERAPKDAVEDALSREEIFQNFADIAKTVYNAASRMITVRQQITDELKMTDGK